MQLLGKAEWFNPSGSVKDRPAANIMREALRSGDLGAGKRLLDSTSGNMGIAYATFGAAAGIPVTLCVPGSASPERIMILKALGAEVIVTDASEGSDGAILEARRLAKSEPDRYWYANQYDNPANWQAHYWKHGSGNTGSDERHGHALHRRPGHFGNAHGRWQIPAGAVAECEDRGGAAGRRFSRPGGPEAYAHRALRPGIYDPAFADQVLGHGD